jgi:type VI secretion system Hcp family effector
MNYVSAAPTEFVQGFLTIQGITDNAGTIYGHEDSSEVLGLQHVVILPVSQTGGGGGSQRAEFKLLQVTKPIDLASPGLFLSLVQGTEIHHVTIDLVNVPYTIYIEGVTITGIDQHYDPLNSAQRNVGNLEDITFSFERIAWIWRDPEIITGWDLEGNTPFG